MNECGFRPSACRQVADRIAQVHQDIAVAPGAARDAHGEIGPADLMGKGGGEGRRRGIAVVVGQGGKEGRGQILGADLRHQPGQLGEFLAVEARARLGVDGRSVREGLAVGEAQLVAGQLAVEGRLELGGRPISLGGALGPARRLLCAAHPIGSARLADRRSDRIVHPLEMAEGDLVIVEEAQRDPAGQPFRVGQPGAVDLAMLLGETIGRTDMARGEGVANQDVPLGPPEVRPRHCVGQAEEKRAGIFHEVLAPAPADALIDQAGVGLEFGGDAFDIAVHAGAHRTQGHARAGQATPVLADVFHGPLRAVFRPGPKQAVEPGDVVGFPEVFAVGLQEVVFLAAAEAAFAPGFAQQGHGDFGLAQAQLSLGQGDPPVGADRGKLDEPGDDRGGVHVAGHGFLGAALEQPPVGPVGIGPQEAGDLAEARLGPAATHLIPAQSLVEQRVGALGAVALGRVPILPLDIDEGGLVGTPLSFAQSLGACGAREKRSGAE